MADIEKTISVVPSEKTDNINSSAVALSEFDEYVGLCEVMTEERLKKLVRKIE
jgi:hypothetical protein